MASSAISKLTATEQAQFFYVTYYGRPADPAGLKYWADVISKNGLDSVAKDFSNSAEAKVKYPSLYYVKPHAAENRYPDALQNRVWSRSACNGPSHRQAL